MQCLAGHPGLACASQPAERPHNRLHCPLPRQLALHWATSAAAAGQFQRQQQRRQRAGLRPRAAAGDDVDVAVFRFTLGIPGFDDAFIPRVVGCLGVALLVVNHALGGQPPPDAQVRAEALGALLSAVAIAAPSLEQRLKELEPGRGRMAAAGAVEGAVSSFALLPGLPEDAKKELAWSSFALLRNTNICGLLVFHRGRAVMCRGLVGAAGVGPAPGDAAAALASLSQTWGGGPEEEAYCPDRTAMDRAGLAAWACVPAGVATALAQPLRGAAGGGASKGTLVLLSERPRALSGRERAWAAAIAAKLHAVLGATA